jgi:hypothetical protein
MMDMKVGTGTVAAPVCAKMRQRLTAPAPQHWINSSIAVDTDVVGI